MSILEAELRKRDGQGENVVTSRVLGVICDANRSIVLWKFLQELGIDISKDDSTRCVCRGWPTYRLSQEETVEPDWEIKGQDFLLLVEAKLGNDANASQLERELRAACAANPRARLLCVTNSATTPHAFEQAKEKVGLDADRLVWKPWKWFYEMFARMVEEEEIDPTSKRLLEGAAMFLEQKGMRGFRDFGVAQKYDLSCVMADIRTLLQEMVLLVREVSGVVEASGIQPLEESYCHPLASASWDKPQAWIPTLFNFAFRDRTWPEAKKWSACLYIRFYLEERDIWVGYLRSLQNPEDIREHVASTSKEIHDVLCKNGDMKLCPSPTSFYYRGYTISGEELDIFDASHEEEKIEEKIISSADIELFYSVSFEEAQVPILAQYLARCRDAASELGLEPPLSQEG